MNLDERLEALTQSVELMASMPKGKEKRMERLEQSTERLAQAMERIAVATDRLTKGGTRLENLVTEIAEGTALLLHVVEMHEQRLSDLEGNQSQQ
jgi:hypothetical protein